MYKAQLLYSDGSARTVSLIEKQSDGDTVLTLPEDALSPVPDAADFLTGCAPAFEGEEGYIILNNRMVHFKNHEDGEYDAGYCIMPFYGVKTPRECFIAIAVRAAEDHRILVSRKDGVYTARMRFQLDGISPAVLPAVRIHPLSGEDADYCGMARAYREYQLGRGACVPIKDRLTPELEYMLHAPEIRIRLAWKPVPTPVAEQTPETEPPMHVAATFDRVGEIMEACKAGGIEKAEFCLVGWNLRGHDGRWPTAFPVEPALGGEDGLRRLIAKAKSLGYSIVCHTNSTDCYSISDVWSEALPMREKDGRKQTHANWGGGQMYNMCPVSGGEKYSIETLDGVRELGFHGIHYIDVISTVQPYRCFAPEHPCSRQEFVASMRRIAAHARENMGGFQSEGGFDYMAPDLDIALYVDFHMDSNPHPLCDDNVPIWQMVYHDIILSNPGTMTVNYPCKEAVNRLKFIEYGGHPAMYIYSKFTQNHHWMGEADFTCNNESDLDATVRGLRQMNEDYARLDGTQLVPIVRHERTADQLAVVTYENGLQVVCNYSEEKHLYRGKEIPALDFRVFDAV